VAVVEPLEMPYLAVEADHGCHGLDSKGPYSDAAAGEVV
jgi:hypothetical protein